MASNASRGAYYKLRTKTWFESTGWTVALLERVNWIIRPGARPIPVKKDQLGADLLAVNDASVVFAQVKFFGTDDRRNAMQVKAAAAQFAQFPCPPTAQQWIVVWHRGVRAPRIIVVDRRQPDMTGVESAASTDPKLPFGRPRAVPPST